ncbi:hypothetical protein P43SY_011669 [Pythium insidiosum]|uniref:Endonuclease/exonuclease/phosphatase domain-containing protein n=1 Tax=Pythium insidiosum TaxID=114742 RepID=A0AAD5LQ86_PYTIN|nr:hypothetical protein P43SY_011669 [Pythium insidiosum]
MQVVVEWRRQETSEPPRRLIVANTHLLFNPGRGDVKLAQLERLLSSLAALRQVSDSDAALPLVLCGDFNLMPHSALYEFLSRRSLDVSGLSKHLLSGQNMDHRQASAVFQREKDTARHHGHGTAVGRFDRARARRSYFHHFPRDTVATHELDLVSAYAQAPDDECTGEPKFTTFHEGTKGTVDYIWFTRDDVHCHGVVEMAPAGQLFNAASLPTAHHASDHLSLVADVSLR